MSTRPARSMKKNPKPPTKPRFAFFGTSHIAVYVLEALEKAGFLPELVVTVAEKAKGRGLAMQSSAVESWASARGIVLAYDWKEFEEQQWDVAIVCDYGKIIPEKILAVPQHGCLNVHPSLLPRLRGSSPMRSLILNDEKTTGVSIIALDEQMDHGPIVAQKKVEISNWPPRNSELETTLLTEGGALLAKILPLYLAGEIEPQPQNHDVATYCGKFTKEDGLLDLAGDVRKNLLKIRAFEGWPGTYAFFERAGKKVRVQILDAHLDSDKLIIDTVKPEGKREMSYEEFLRSGAKPTN